MHKNMQNKGIYLVVSKKNITFAAKLSYYE